MSTLQLIKGIFISGVSVVRRTGGIVRRLRVSDTVTDFAKENEAVWDQFDSDHTGNSLTLIDGTIRRIDYIHPIAIVGKYISEITNTDSFIISSVLYDRKWEHVYTSYNIKNIIRLTARYRFFHKLVRSISDACALYQQVETPADILSIEYHNIEIGDLIYNTYLTKNGVGTIDAITPRLVWYIFLTTSYINYYELLIERYNVENIVLRDIHYIRNGSLLRTAVQVDQAITAYVLGSGRSKVSVKKYNLEIINQHDLRLSMSMFRELYEIFDEEIEEKIDTFLSERLSGAAARVDAFDDKKRIVDQQSLINELNLDPHKPIVVIMSHIFTDAVHVGDLLFNDYVSWLRETVDFAVNAPEANWLVKPHPNVDAPIYDSVITAEEITVEATRGEDDHTVRILPKDINTSSLNEFAEVIITARGTGALEFGCLGIPSVLAGESHYSGFGFTVEPKDKSEYFHQLSNVGSLSPLSPDEQRRAKTVAYFRFILSQKDSTMVPDEMDDFLTTDQKNLLQSVRRTVANTDLNRDPLYENLGQYLEDDRINMVDYNVMQALNRSKEDG